MGQYYHNNAAQFDKKNNSQIEKTLINLTYSKNPRSGQAGSAKSLQDVKKYKEYLFNDKITDPMEPETA